MKRAEAEKLIGKNVICWTGLRGSYIGELLEVFNSPWRGNVKILAINTYPTQGLSSERTGFMARKPFNYGEIRDFGGVNITSYDGPVNDYTKSLTEALQNEIKNMRKYIENAQNSKHSFNIEKRALEVLEKELQKQIAKGGE